MFLILLFPETFYCKIKFASDINSIENSYVQTATNKLSDIEH